MDICDDLFEVYIFRSKDYNNSFKASWVMKHARLTEKYKVKHDKEVMSGSVRVEGWKVRCRRRESNPGRTVETVFLSWSRA